MENIQTDSNEIQTKSNRGGARPGAGRPKKSNEPLTKADRIAIIEKRIQDPNISPRDLKSLSRELALLRGESRPYARNVPEQKERDAVLADPPELPSWWSKDWCECFLVESLAGKVPSWWQYKAEMSRYWAGLSDDEKQALVVRARRIVSAERLPEFDRQHPGAAQA